MTIVLVGWLMAFYPFVPFLERLARLRIPGVLPRIGVVYVLGTWLVLAVWKRRVGRRRGGGRRPPRRSTRGSSSARASTSRRQGNVQRAVDLAVLKGHLWKNAQGWDPEGIVSTLTAIATMLTGTLTGFLLKGAATVQAEGRAPPRLGGGRDRGGPPVGTRRSRSTRTSGPLRTSSSRPGAALVALALCLFVVDVLGWKRPFAFFFTFGTNPLLVFVLSGLLAKTFGLVKWTDADGKASRSTRGSTERGFSWIADPTLRSHAFALVTILFWWAVLRVFEKTGWFWKI